MTKKEVKQIEQYFNSGCKAKQINVYDYDKSMIQSHRIVVFFARILTNRKLKIPKYIKVFEIQDKDIIFHVSVKNIVDILFLDEPMKD